MYTDALVFPLQDIPTVLYSSALVTAFINFTGTKASLFARLHKVVGIIFFPFPGNNSISNPTFPLYQFLYF